MIKRACIITLLCAVMALAGCASAPADASGSTAPEAQTSEQATTSEPELVDCPVRQDTDFGNVFIDISIEDFNALGFAYGDTIHVAFSNGFEDTVPYLNGYYGKVGSRMLVASQGNDCVLYAENFGESMWEATGMKEGDTATVTLVQAGGFADLQESFNIRYTDERTDYASDAVFANFRSLVGGSLAPDAVYRSASPIDDEHNRAGYVEQLMADAGVRFVLNLSDDEEEMDEFIAEAKEKGVDTSYFEQLRESGNVVGINLRADYPSEAYAKKLVGGLVALSEHDGPYLLHCVEGKDRTGFSCMLLEALAGATYDEMLADYMTTFDNYYGISQQSDPKRFDTIAHTNFDSMLESLPGLEDADVQTAADYVEPARAYLRRGGMTDEQIDALLARIVA